VCGRERGSSVCSFDRRGGAVRPGKGKGVKKG
jgi:hypothetical protein